MTAFLWVMAGWFVFAALMSASLIVENRNEGRGMVWLRLAILAFEVGSACWAVTLLLRIE